MKLLAFTDIHGSYEKTESIIRHEASFDGIIIAGDLTTIGSAAEAEQALHRFQSFGKPLFVVSGNMDPPELDEVFDRMGLLVSGKGAMLGDVGIFGVSGSPVTPMKTPYEISEEEIRKRAEKGWREVENALVKIFVPHAPPHGTTVDKIFIGKHVGSVALREFVEKYQPDVLVCGHIHEARGKDLIGKTLIVNCGPAGKGYYAVIEVGKEVKVELKG
ncbi:MAG TPA: metallophosphoesterase [Bacteroidota bacterium]|nr:metallophosphoesterase [Bacteroidota bacterium]